MDYEKKYKEALCWMRSVYPTMTGTVKEDAEHFFPELKESGDERIRKEIIDVIRHSANSMPAKKFNERIAWLERQGEQKSTDITDKLKEEYQKGWDNAMQQLPKEVDSQIWQIANNAAKTWEESFSILYATQKAYDKGKKDALKEQKPAWSEEDDNCLSTIIAEFSKCAGKSVSKDEWMRCNDFLNSLRDRVQPQPKQEWSEEEKARIDKIVDVLDWAEEKGYIRYSDWENYICYVKSLRPQKQWKPTKEQMDAIEHICDGNFDVDLDILDSIYRDFKKLREE